MGSRGFDDRGIRDWIVRKTPLARPWSQVYRNPRIYREQTASDRFIAAQVSKPSASHGLATDSPHSLEHVVFVVVTSMRDDRLQHTAGG